MSLGADDVGADGYFGQATCRARQPASRPAGTRMD